MFHFITPLYELPHNNLLEQGDIYIADGGFLKVVGKTEIFSGSFEATVSVGSVTVSIS